MRRLVAAAALALVSCGGDSGDGGGDLPLVDQIAPAIDAVEAEMGGAQEYFEVTAERQRVKVFVAVDDASNVVGYVYIDGELAPPGPAAPADGFTFAASDIEFDPDTVFGQVTSDLPETSIVSFSVVGTEEGPVHYGAFTESEQGGGLDITLSADGDVLGVAPAG